MKYPVDANGEGAGRKGSSKRKSRDCVSQPMQQEREDAHEGHFTKVCHNNKPLIVVHVTTVPNDRNLCGYRGMVFSIGTSRIVLYGIVIKHEERWEHPKQSSQNEGMLHLPCANQHRESRI